MQDRMSPAERMGALMMGQKPDRVPVSPFIMGYAAKVCGIPLGDIYADAKKSFKAHMLCMELHGYDTTPLYGYASVGAWEFGGEVGMPYGKGHGAPYVIRHPLETEEQVDKCEVPDPKKAGSMPIALEFAKLCNSYGMPAVVQTGEVLTYAGNILEPARLMLWMRRKPQTVHRLLDKISDFIIECASLWVDTFGAEKCMAFTGGPVESNKLISPKQFEEFVLPYMEKIHGKVLGMGILSIMEHPCADQNKNLPYYRKLREDLNWKGKYVWNFGPETPLDVQIKNFGDHDIIGGNVDPPSFQLKSYDEVLQLCKENIEQGMNSPSGFVLMPGCEMPPLAPPVNVHAMMKAVREFGQYK